jgi:hypothetical protein
MPSANALSVAHSENGQLKQMGYLDPSHVSNSLQSHQSSVETMLKEVSSLYGTAAKNPRGHFRYGWRLD